MFRTIFLLFHFGKLGQKQSGNPESSVSVLYSRDKNRVVFVLLFVFPKRFVKDEKFGCRLCAGWPEEFVKNCPKWITINLLLKLIQYRNRAQKWGLFCDFEKNCPILAFAQSGPWLCGQAPNTIYLFFYDMCNYYPAFYDLYRCVF
jgi:hypothetical protein